MSIHQRFDLVAIIFVLRSGHPQRDSQRSGGLDRMQRSFAGGESSQVTDIVVGLFAQGELRSVDTMGNDGDGLQIRIRAPLMLRNGGDIGLRRHFPKPGRIVIRNNVRGVHNRCARERLERNSPKIGMAVQNIESTRFRYGPAEIHPLAKAPVVQRARRAVGSRKRCH